METVDGQPIIKMAADRQDYPGLADALRRLSAQQDVFLINQITRLGCPDPTARLAHLVLELRWRLQMARLATTDQLRLTTQLRYARRYSRLARANRRQGRENTAPPKRAALAISADQSHPDEPTATNYRAFTARRPFRAGNSC